MTFLTTTVPSIWYTIHLFVTLVRIKPESDDSLSVIIGVICNETVLYAQSFENYLDRTIQYLTELSFIMMHQCDQQLDYVPN